MVDLDKPKTEERILFDGTIRDLRKEDLTPLIPILGTWIKDRNTGEPLPDEVQETIQIMLDSVEGRNPRTYIVAEALDGEVIGVIGFKDPDVKMGIWASTSTPAELINAYVKADERKGKGVGKALVAKLEEKAKSQGYTEIILRVFPS